MAKKLMSTFALLAALSLLGTWVFLIVPLRNSLHRQSYNMLVNAASVVGASCCDLFQATQKASYNMLWFDELFEILEQSNDGVYQLAYRDQMQYVRLLATNIIPDERVFSLGIYNNNEVLIMEAITDINNNAAFEHKWFDIADQANGKCVWTSIYVTQALSDLQTDVGVVSMYRTIISPDTFRKVGTMRVTLNIDVINDIFMEYQSEPNLAVYLINGTGELLASTLTDQQGTLAVPLDLHIDPKVYANHSEPAMSDNLIVVDIGINDLYVVFQLSKNYFTDELPLLNSTWIMTAMLGLVMLAMIGISSIYLSRPAHELQTTMQQVTSGNMSLRARTHGNDEIAKLGMQFNLMMDSMQQMIDDLSRAHQREYEMRVESLQLQMNPHFLFNTLDNVRWLAMKHNDIQTAEYMVVLARLLHRSINFKPFSTLQEELDIADDFIQLEKLRFGDKLDYHLVVDDRARGLLVPTYLIQPLLENSIVHGFLNKESTYTIFVMVTLKKDKMIIDVSDNGAGSGSIEEKQMMIDGKKTPTHVMALCNLAQRIRLYFGEDYKQSVKIFSEKGMGARVVIILPACNEAYQKWIRE